MIGSFGGEGGEFFVVLVPEYRLYRRMREMAASTNEKVSVMMRSMSIWIIIFFFSNSGIQT